MSHGTWNTVTSNTGFHSYCCYMWHHSLCCSGSYTSPPSLDHIDPRVHGIHTCHTTRNSYSKNNIQENPVKAYNGNITLNETQGEVRDKVIAVNGDVLLNMRPSTCSQITTRLPYFLDHKTHFFFPKNVT